MLRTIRWSSIALGAFGILSLMSVAVGLTPVTKSGAVLATSAALAEVSDKLIVLSCFAVPGIGLALRRRWSRPVFLACLGLLAILPLISASRGALDARHLIVTEISIGVLVLVMGGILYGMPSMRGYFRGLTR